MSIWGPLDRSEARARKPAARPTSTPKEKAMTQSPNTPGRFVCHRLKPPNLKASLAFYTELHGWGTSEMDMGPGGKYTILKAGEQQVGGIAVHGADKGIPPSWLAYCSVSDVDAATKKALELGGRAMQPPTDI